MEGAVGQRGQLGDAGVVVGKLLVVVLAQPSRLRVAVREDAGAPRVQPEARARAGVALGQARGDGPGCGFVVGGLGGVWGNAPISSPEEISNLRP